jgi:hypothetical protein
LSNCNLISGLVKPVIESEYIGFLGLLMSEMQLKLI